MTRTQDLTPHRPMVRSMTRATVLLLALLTACSGNESLPSISVFTASPSTIVKGGKATLIFATRDATTLTLDKGIGDVTGQAKVEVSPTETTTYTLTAAGPKGGATSQLTITVGPTPASGFKLAAVGPVVAGLPARITVTAVDPSGATVPSYTGRLTLMSNDERAEAPTDVAFVASDRGVKTVQVTFKTAGPHVLLATGTVGGGMTGSFSTTSDPFQVKAGAAKELRLAAQASETESGVEVPLQVSLFDALGNPAQDYEGTLHVTLSDDTVPPLADVTLTAADKGATTVKAMFFKAGVQTVLVRDTKDDAVKAMAEVRVRASTAASYALSALPSTARAGEPLSLTLTALDKKGNRATTYSGIAHFSSAGSSEPMPADTTFAQGVATVSVSFRAAGDHTVTVTEVDGTLTATTNAVKVTPASPSAIVLSGAGSATAGVETAVTATVKDVFGNVATGYTGTVGFTLTDAQGDKPAAYTFTATDSGAHTFAVTFKTAGPQGLTVADAVASLSGSSTVAVSPAATASCVLSDVPQTATAGTTLPVRVTVRDAFGNTATGYSGTVSLTSTDTSPDAVLSPAATFVPAQDQGSRVFGVKLVSSGAQTVTAADTDGLSCSASVSVKAASPRLVVALPTDANAAAPVTATVTAKDGYGNVIANFAGSVALTTTDAAATLSTQTLTFTGAEGGTQTLTATFNTLGAQKLMAAQVEDSTVTGTGTTAVHGFVYTDPQQNQGKVRLVVNAAKSSTSVVQLDLVSNTTLTVSGTTTARGGAYSAGMNLPLDTSRAAADSTLLVEGNALNLGAAPKAVAAALPTSGTTAGVLYTGVSQKFAGAGKVTADVSVIPGRIFYSVRLKLPGSATVGTVFDGASLNTKFRAAVRTRAGEEVLTNPDFALGKLEVR